MSGQLGKPFQGAQMQNGSGRYATPRYLQSMAIGQQSGKNPAASFTHSDGPYVNTDVTGTQIASNWTALLTSGPAVAIAAKDGASAPNWLF